MTQNLAKRDWDDLSATEQLRLREAFGRYLDTLPPTCSMDTKLERFRHWLSGQGVDYRQSQSD
jgi:hypothetical protein